MNHSEWLKRGVELHKGTNSHQFVLGDWLNSGIAAFGREAAFDAVQKIASNKRNFFTRCATVAALYRPELRFPTLPFHTYEMLKHFEMSFLEKFLPSIATCERSCRQILHLAIEKFGSNPAPYKKRMGRQRVSLNAALYLAACERAKAEKTHVQFWIEQILASHLGVPQGAGKTAPPDSPSSGNEADDSSPRPTYAARRAAQKAERLAAKKAAAQQRSETSAASKAQREAAKLAKQQAREQKLLAKRDAEENRKAELKDAGKFSSKIEIAFTDCKGPDNEFVDGTYGAVKIPKKTRQRADRFHSLEDALKAAREYSEDRHYVVVPFMCKRCSNGKPVYHLRAAAEVDLSMEQEEIRIQVNDFIQSTRASLRQQHAQA